MRRLIAAAALLFATPLYSQAVIPTDASALQAQVDAANAAASAALTKANGAVQKVGGTSPDGTGNVTLPTAFSGTTCTGCAMSSPSFTGTPTVNGNPLVTSVNGATGDVTGLATTSALSAYAPLSTLSGYSTTSALSTAISGEVTARNTAIGTATAGLVSSVNGVAPVAGAVTIPTSTFVAGFTPSSPGTWANLLSTAPCNSARVANYAVVSDLYSGASNTNEVIRCGLTGTTYTWRPQRENFAANVSTTGGSITFTCGVSPPIMFVSGTLAANLTTALSPSNCWAGAFANIANGTTLGISSFTVTGLLGGLTKTLGLNGRATFYFDGSAWQAF